MVKTDQKMRRGMRRGRKFDNQIDVKNTREFKKILDRYGWPKKSVFGENVSNGAWLIVQHADHDIDFQESCLKVVKRLEKINEISRQVIPLLIDRVRVNQGRKQIYGTQFYTNEKNQLVPLPLTNPSKVNSSRKKYGLSSLASYRRLLLRNVSKTAK